MALSRSAGDNSKANTISDKEWRELRIKPGRAWERDVPLSRDQLHQTRRGNN